MRRPAATLIALTFALSPWAASAEAPVGLPAPGQVRDVQIMRATPDSSGPNLRRLRRILRSARVVPRETTPDPHRVYRPWCAGSFVTPHGPWRFVLFRGGRGDLITPGGARLRISFDASLAPGG